MVSNCLRDAVDPSRSIPGRGDPGIEAGSSGGGGVGGFGNPGIQFVEPRRMTIPTRQRKVFLGGGIVDIVSRQFAREPDGLREKFRRMQEKIIDNKPKHTMREGCSSGCNADKHRTAQSMY